MELQELIAEALSMNFSAVIAYAIAVLLAKIGKPDGMSAWGWFVLGLFFDALIISGGWGQAGDRRARLYALIIAALFSALAFMAITSILKKRRGKK